MIEPIRTEIGDGIQLARAPRLYGYAQEIARACASSCAAPSVAFIGRAEVMTTVAEKASPHAVPTGTKLAPVPPRCSSVRRVAQRER